MKNQIKKMTLISLFAATSLGLFVIELQIPSFSGIPGIKPGLANIVTLFLINLGENWKTRDVFMVLLIRILLSVLINGQPITLFFSLTAGIAALSMMTALKNTLKLDQVLIISVAGAVTHNITQLIVAGVVISFSVLGYLPFYLIASIITGIFTGLIVKFLLSREKFISILKQ
ncbi:MAG: Gx transporter family protein [Eubacterium sp.]|jgi:heptaprenyl diphosphate synthase|nr:Gx transporter family protein [Eubacterium sp.]